MSTEVLLPKIGFSMNDAVLSHWLKTASFIEKPIFGSRTSVLMDSSCQGSPQRGFDPRRGGNELGLQCLGKRDWRVARADPPDGRLQLAKQLLVDVGSDFGTHSKSLHRLVHDYGTP